MDTGERFRKSFLNFADPLDPYVQNKKPKKKASGGSVTMPDNYRKGGRVRML